MFPRVRPACPLVTHSPSPPCHPPVPSPSPPVPLPSPVATPCASPPSLLVAFRRHPVPSPSPPPSPPCPFPVASPLPLPASTRPYLPLPASTHLYPPLPASTPGGASSGGAGGVGVEAPLVEDTAALSRRSRPASPPGFPSVPQFPPRLSQRSAAQSLGCPSRHARAHIAHCTSRPMRSVSYGWRVKSRSGLPRVKEEPHPQQQEKVEEEPHLQQQERVEEEPHP
ncbi:unnamed protein product [Closterium sp. NIES-64]|nr:unnamed protein product [Closterium sp. NIES-64]